MKGRVPLKQVMAIAEGCRQPQCPANHVCNYYGMPINLLHKRIKLSKASRNQGKQSTANLAYQVRCWVKRHRLHYCTTTVHCTTTLLLPSYYCTTVLLHYCTAIVLLYYYCTTTVLLRYYYCTTTVILLYYCTTHHCTAPGLRREGSVGWRQKSSE